MYAKFWYICLPNSKLWRNKNIFTSKEVLGKNTKGLLHNPSEISPKTKNAHQWLLICTFGLPMKGNVA